MQRSLNPTFAQSGHEVRRDRTDVILSRSEVLPSAQILSAAQDDKTTGVFLTINRCPILKMQNGNSITFSFVLVNRIC